MKKIIIAATFAAVSLYAASVAQAAPASSAQSCVTNWVGGACGTTLNNGSDGSTSLVRVVDPCSEKKGRDGCDCEK